MGRLLPIAILILGTAALCYAAKDPSKDLPLVRCPQPSFSNTKKGSGECDLHELAIPGYRVSKPSCQKDCGLKAGAFKIDITPPPGFPMGGHGFIARFGRGYWTRLYARAFFFRDNEGHSLAFVTCDLGAMAGGLQAQVAKLLHDYDEKQNDEKKLNISRDNLILAATHTHQGPGNFMSYKLYNDIASPAQGFDRKLFDRLAERIAKAIEDAASDAEVSANQAKTVLRLKEGKVTNLLRNRAPSPFMLNTDRIAVLKDGPNTPCDPRDPWETPYPSACPRYRAVDERIAVLEICRLPNAGGKEQHVGSLVFLSVHPTSMSHQTELYQSDFTGLAMSLLERRYPDGKFVAGFFNGADGDISVQWHDQNRNETVVFAQYLRGVIEALEKSLDSLTMDSSAKFLVARTEIPGNCYFTEDSWTRDTYSPWCYRIPKKSEDDEICISGEPMYGAPTLGGGEDGRTPLFDLGWKSGVRTVPWDLQGVKQEAFQATFLPFNLTWAIARPCFYPETIPLSFVRLEAGAKALNFGVLPAELTRTAWRRIEKSDELTSLGRILPVGLANEYIGYVTTREEYAAQAYEGGSTIYGPQTAEMLRWKLIELSQKLQPPVPQETVVEPSFFYPEKKGGGRNFKLEEDEMQAAYGDRDEALEPLILDSAGLPERHWPRFEWRENKKVIEDWDASKRFVEIYDCGTKKPVDDDSGPNILTVYVNPEDGKAHGPRELRYRSFSHWLSPLIEGHGSTPAPAGDRSWIAIWLVPNPTVKRTLYFRVRRSDKTSACSESFLLPEAMAEPLHNLQEVVCP